MGQYHNVGMGVHIDEARADHESTGVDYPARLRRVKPAGGGYAVAMDANITGITGAAGAIDYPATAYHQVEHVSSFSQACGTSLLYQWRPVKPLWVPLFDGKSAYDVKYWWQFTLRNAADWIV